MTLTSNFFDVVLFLFSSLVTGPSFMSICRHVITGSGIITIFFYKGLTRNPEMGNTPVWVFPNNWRLGQVMDTKFGTSVTNRMLLNAAKFQRYSFCGFWVIKRKPTGGREITPHPPPPLQIRIKKQKMFQTLFYKNQEKWYETECSYLSTYLCLKLFVFCF